MQDFISQSEVLKKYQKPEVTEDRAFVALSAIMFLVLVVLFCYTGRLEQKLKAQALERVTSSQPVNINQAILSGGITLD